MLTAESCQLSYWIAIGQRRKGYATAVARLAVALAFDRHGRERVCSFVREGNTASARVLERAGLRPAGRARGGLTTWSCIRAEQREGQLK
jgi:RimJ/RimL family protein N-acetyltransferase